MTQQQHGGGGRGGRPRSNPRRIFVESVEQLSPRMRRVTFGGEQLATFVWSGPAAHIKIIFPEPGLGLDTVAVPDPEGPRPATTRTYTPRHFDPDKLTLQVDFALHGHGPASVWAAQAKIGQQLVMMGPAQGYPVDAEAEWFVLMADDSALPAVETILEAVPAAAKVTVFVEVPDAGEARALPGPAGTDVRWVTRDGDERGAGTALLAALNGFSWPAGPGRVYVGCESGAMRRLRTEIVAASGVDKTRIVARGYWRIGVQNNPDRDYAED